MNAIELLTKRRSVRRYTDKVVSNEVLKEIVDIAKFSPSWANTQTTRYNFVTSENLLKEIAENGVRGHVYNKKAIDRAKGILVLTYVEGVSGVLEGKVEDTNGENTAKWEVFDAGIACQTFCLAAYEKGVGTCIFGVIDDEKIAKIINLPENEKVAAIITYGYFEDEGKAAPPRKETEELMKVL